MLTEILWLLFWPVFIFASSYLVQFFVKRFEKTHSNTE